MAAARQETSCMLVIHCTRKSVEIDDAEWVRRWRCENGVFVVDDDCEIPTWESETLLRKQYKYARI